MKHFISLLITACFVILAQGQNVKSQKFNLLIGTYTSSSQDNGIYVYDFNAQSGELSYKSKVAGGENPSYLAVSIDGKHVYSVNETGNGTVSAFGFNPVSGALTFLNRASSGGESPCYVSVDDGNKYVFAGNYSSGSLCAIPLKKDGSLGTDIQYIQQEGGSVNKSRQEGPHVHSVVLSPDNHFLLTPNLGTDKVCIYMVDAVGTSKPLTPAEPAFVAVKPGSGPRHITFHPSSKYAYLVQEIEGMITAFDYNNGKLVEKQTITMLPPGFKGKVGAADIHVTPDGKFLYGSNRGDANELVIYAIDNNGRLSYAGRQQTMGKTPRNFVIDPTGNFLLVANQDTNDVIVFKRDQKTGLLSPTGKKIQISKPVCLKFTAEN